MTLKLQNKRVIFSSFGCDDVLQRNEQNIVSKVLDMNVDDNSREIPLEIYRLESVWFMKLRQLKKDGRRRHAASTPND